MDLVTLDIDVERAKAGVDEYRQALRIERNAEDEALIAAYRAAARGLPLISLSAAVAAGGFFEGGLPRIAIARADATHCWVQWDWRDGLQLVYTDRAREWGRNALVGEHTVRVSATPPTHRSGYGGQTVVPSVPPRHRPKRNRLHRYHVLWEVEAWDPTPPRDPALLRHIRGDLWAVLACWDLTDIERHVLAQRSRP